MILIYETILGFIVVYIIYIYMNIYSSNMYMYTCIYTYFKYVFC